MSFSTAKRDTVIGGAANSSPPRNRNALSPSRTRGPADKKRSSIASPSGQSEQRLPPNVTQRKVSTALRTSSNSPLDNVSREGSSKRRPSHIDIASGATSPRKHSYADTAGGRAPPKEREAISLNSPPRSDHWHDRKEAPKVPRDPIRVSTSQSSKPRAQTSTASPVMSEPVLVTNPRPS
jgi:hypothetical protein